jgi:hypothetical protein
MFDLYAHEHGSTYIQCALYKSYVLNIVDARSIRDSFNLTGVSSRDGCLGESRNKGLVHESLANYLGYRNEWDAVFESPNAGSSHRHYLSCSIKQIDKKRCIRVARLGRHINRRLRDSGSCECASRFGFDWEDVARFY